jgi:hypothetical protein
VKDGGEEHNSFLLKLVVVVDADLYFIRIVSSSWFMGKVVKTDDHFL